MKDLDFKAAVEDIRGAYHHIAKHCEKVGVIGFCMGGALAIAALSSIPELKFGLPFYGIPDLSVFPIENIQVGACLLFSLTAPGSSPGPLR